MADGICLPTSEKSADDDNDLEDGSKIEKREGDNDNLRKAKSITERDKIAPANDRLIESEESSGSRQETCDLVGTKDNIVNDSNDKICTKNRRDAIEIDSSNKIINNSQPARTRPEDQHQLHEQNKTTTKNNNMKPKFKEKRPVPLKLKKTFGRAAGNQDTPLDLSRKT